VFLGKRIATPEFKHVRARDGVAPMPTAQPVGAALTGHHPNVGAMGMVAPGTFVLAMVFLTSFVLYYFINWKYLSTIWPLK
jgi:cytochrome c oxidase subunit 1